jgi:hypothetical protein
MKTKTLLLFLVIFCFSGCEKIEVGEAFECHMGINYRVTNDLSLTIKSLNDSRCPDNAVCFWAGTVYLNFNINYNKNSIDTTLYLNPTGENPYIFGNYGFSVLDVSPKTAGTTTSKDINIKMLITNN